MTLPRRPHRGHYHDCVRHQALATLGCSHLRVAGLIRYDTRETEPIHSVVWMHVNYNVNSEHTARIWINESCYSIV